MNILIFTASTGGGHNRASNALKDYILSVRPEWNVEIVDAIETCSKFLNVTVTKGYQLLATKTPGLYGMMYKTSDKESPLSELVIAVNSQYGKKLLPLIEEKQPDVIVSCHPFATNMMSTIKGKYDCQVPVIAILTDFMPHKAYIGENIDAYVTASAETAEVLHEKYGVEKEKIHALGLPVYPRFYDCPEEKKNEIIESLGFDKNKKTVLIMAGSFGVTDILKIYEQIVDVDEDFQIIVITGRNQKLYDAFEKMLSDEDEFETSDVPRYIRELSDDNPFKLLYDRQEQFRETIRETFRRSTTKKKPTQLFYFIDNVEDYMHVSDLIVTKPGGLTTSESIACNLPMAVFKAFPGQEAQNASFLSENGIAVTLEKGEDLADRIRDLLEHPDRLEAMKEACRKVEKKNSCDSIYHLIETITAETEPPHEEEQ